MSESRVAGFLVVDVGITVIALGVAGLRVWYRWSRGQLAAADYLISMAMVRGTESDQTGDIANSSR